MTPSMIMQYALQHLWNTSRQDRWQRHYVSKYGSHKQMGMVPYLQEQWSFKMTRAIIAFRLRLTPWAMAHYFRYEKGELHPPCHLCHIPVNEIDNHLLFECEQIQTFRTQQPFLVQTLECIEEGLKSPTHLFALHKLRFYYAVQNAKPLIETAEPLELDEGFISDNSDVSLRLLEGCPLLDLIYRSRSQASVTPSRRIL